MISLLIPSLAISGSILMGSPYVDEQSHQAEATAILDAGFVYRYNDWPVLGGHDYGVFSRLPEVRKNMTVIIDGKRLHVKQTKIIDDNDMSILDGQTYLMTCINENRDRFTVLLK